MFPVFGTSRGSAVPLFSRVFGTFDVDTNRTQIGHNGTEKIVLCSERLHFAKRLGICLEKEISERCAERIVHRRFSSDNVRTRTRARGTVRPHFSYDNAHARFMAYIEELERKHGLHVEKQADLFAKHLLKGVNV